MAHEDRLAVIINCGTDWVTTLALASVSQRTDFPILLLNCNATKRSVNHFEAVGRHGLRFYYLEWPRRSHGRTLDLLIAQLPSNFVLLLDSDAEILDDVLVQSLMDKIIANSDYYGSGFHHKGRAIAATDGIGKCTGYYAERMWIPLVLLRTSMIQGALARGETFARKRRSGRPHARAIDDLLSHRYLIRSPSQANVSANDAVSSTPKFIEYDTGALMHHHLLREGYRFAALDEDRWPGVAHEHGVTRAAAPTYRRRVARLLGAVDENATAQRQIADKVRRRLADVYGLRFDT